MPQPITTNGLGLRPENKPVQRTVLLSQDHKPKEAPKTYDLDSVKGVIKRNQRTGLAPLQSQDLRGIAERKQMMRAMAEKKAAAALAKASRPAPKAPAKPAGKGGAKKTK